MATTENSDTGLKHLPHYYYQVRVWHHHYGLRFLVLCLFGCRNVWCTEKALLKKIREGKSQDEESCTRSFDSIDWSKMRNFRKSLGAECNMKALAVYIVSSNDSSYSANF